MTAEETAIENARDAIYARINHAHKELALAKSELASFDMLYGDGNQGNDPA